MQTQNAIEHLVIVGGGSAGWMTAAMLAKQTQGSLKITLIESEDIGTVGVGEATIPPFRTFNNLLGINENAFLKATQGTFKLGIDFANWHKKGQRYFHQFGPFGKALDYTPTHFYWLKSLADGQAKSLEEYSLSWQIAKQNKFSRPAPDQRALESTFDYAYHFDASLYAGYLRQYAEKLGVKRQEGKINKVNVNPVSGFIDGVTLESETTIAGDFFIDCSGFRALLMGEALGVGYQDWRQYLPCDRAWAVPCKSVEPLKPYTRAIAHNAGWQWRIPLQSRIGNGHVFCSDYISEQEAADTLMQNLDGKALSDPRLLKFTTGRRDKFWHKNCVTIGLSAGFLEPLESTSLHLIQKAILRLVTFFPNKQCDDVLADEFNRVTSAEYEYLRDFLILHYHQTARDDSEFWRYCRNMQIPDALAYKVKQFAEYGHLIPESDNLFKHDSWLAVMIGQGIQPKNLNPIVGYKHAIDHNRTLNAMRQAMISSVEQIPSHKEYINKHCKADN